MFSESFTQVMFQFIADETQLFMKMQFHTKEETLRNIIWWIKNNLESLQSFHVQ